MRTRPQSDRRIRCIFNFVVFIAFVLPVCSRAFEYADYEKKIKTNYNVRYAVDKVPLKTIEETLRSFIASGRPSRAYGNSGHEKVQAYLENILRSHNSKNSECEGPKRY